MPLISVIVPTRKRNHLLPRSLRSLYAQTFKDFEIILVDDNPPESRVSKDPALESILSEPRLRLVENKNPRNAAAARNAGLRIATGQWITYLDDDDAYRPTKLEKQLRRAQETKLSLGLCGHVFNLVGRRRIKQVDQDMYSGTDLLLKTLPGTQALFHVNTNQRFNENLYAGEDCYFFLQLVNHLKVDRVFNVPEPLVEVYAHTGPRVNLNGEAVWQANLAIYTDFAKNYGEMAAQVFFNRNRLHYYKSCSGGWGEMFKLSYQLIKLQGSKETRSILNAMLFKIPFFRRFVI